MLQRQTLKYWIVFIISIQCVCTFEVFISKTKDDQDKNMEPIGPARNKSYEIPLFQTRYIIIRAHPNDFHGKTNNVIGFKFQMKSSIPDIIRVRKENIEKKNNIDTILGEDLYISPRKNSLGHIFNAYPSPTFIYSKQKTNHNLAINSTWSVEGVTMNITNLTVHLKVFYDDDTSSSHIRSLAILVTQPKRRIDIVFFIFIPFIVISISILMGTLLDTNEIMEIVRKPKAVLIGFVAQYGLMPFLAMGIAKLFHYTPLNSLALFVIGCCPGSGASNQWTVIFNGDVNLSAIMSFVSTATSFIMMPLYFYTLGKLYMDDLAISVPFLGLARSLGMVVVPYAIGIIISHFFPKARLFVERCIKPIMIFLLLFFLTFGLIVNWYLLAMFDLYTVLTAPLLPFLGFFFGALLAKICQLEWKQVKTIGIEAGIQNTGIAFMIIMYSFPQPYATQALIVPMIVAFLSTKPFWVILIIRNRINKYKAEKKRKELEQSNTDGKLIITNDKPSLNHKENMQQL